MLPLIAAALFLSLVELDRHAGAFMLSRPLVIGPVMGLAFGQIEIGAAIGVLMELLSLESVPLGASLAPNATVAVSTALLLSLGAKPVPISFSLPLGLAAGWLFRSVETRIGSNRARLAREADKCLESGREPAYGQLVLAGLTAQALVTAACLLLVVLALRPALFWAWPYTPVLVQKGLTFAFAVLPILALATMINSLRPAKVKR